MSTVAIVDIGSTSVGGALIAPAAGLSRPPRRGEAGRAKAERNKSERVCSTIIASSRNEIAFQEKVDLDHFLNGIGALLKQTLTDLQQHGLPRGVMAGHASPRHIELFLSAPFYAAQTLVSRLKKPEPFTVTPAVVSDLVRSEATKLERDDHKLIEHKIMQFRLNGYPLAVPYGHQVTELEIVSYVGIASTKVLHSFREAVRSVFHRDDLQWHSFTFAFFSLLNRILPADHCFLIIDVGGEITELSVMGKGVLQGSASFPRGRNSLIRSLAEKLKTTPSEAYDSLKLFARELQHPSVTNTMLAAIGSIREEWSELFITTLSQIMSECLFFERAYVVGDPAMVPLFRAWVGERSVETVVAGRQPVVTETVTDDLLNHFCHRQALVAPDPSLMVETIFYDTIATST